MKLRSRLAAVAVAALFSALAAVGLAGLSLARADAVAAVSAVVCAALTLAASLLAVRAVRSARAGFGALAATLDRLGAEGTPGGMPAASPRARAAISDEFAGALADAARSDERFKSELARLSALTEARSSDLVAAYNELQTKNEGMRREMRMARRVQSVFVPAIDSVGTRPEIAFGAWYATMENLGGDLYDIIRVGRNAYGLLVLDVSGHGVAAALLTALAKVSFRHATGWGVPPSDTLSRVNADLRAIVSGTDMFMTAFYAIANLETKELSYSNGGHHPPVVFNRLDGSVSRLDTKGPFLGVFDDAKFETRVANLVPGDRLAIFTDGVVEARDFMKAEYGYERLERRLRVSAESGPQEFVDGVVADIDAFTMSAPRRDDQTMLVFDYDGDKGLAGSASRRSSAPRNEPGSGADAGRGSVEDNGLDALSDPADIRTEDAPYDDEMVAADAAESGGRMSHGPADNEKARSDDDLDVSVLDAEEDDVEAKYGSDLPIEQRFHAALAMARDGHLSAAERSLRRLHLERSDEPSVLNNLGVVLTRLRKREEAIVCFEKALVLVPGSPRYRKNLVLARRLPEERD